MVRSNFHCFDQHVTKLMQRYLQLLYVELTWLRSKHVSLFEVCYKNVLTETKVQVGPLLSLRTQRYF